jgi:hypothetical protein
MYIDCANVSRSMWIKSELHLASNHSQNYVFRATDQICLYKIEYLMYRDGLSSPHINTGL